MSNIVEAKVRRIGTSLGILLPIEIIRKENIKEDENVEIVILKRNIKLLEEAFGSAKKAKRFKRDSSNRL